MILILVIDEVTKIGGQMFSFGGGVRCWAQKWPRRMGRTSGLFLDVSKIMPE